MHTRRAGHLVTRPLNCGVRRHERSMHPDHAALAKRIDRVHPDSRLEPLSEAQLQSIAAEFPGAPQHYLQFLRDIGWGSFGDNFMFYSGPVAPSDVFDVET